MPSLHNLWWITVRTLLICFIIEVQGFSAESLVRIGNQIYTKDTNQLVLFRGVGEYYEVRDNTILPSEYNSMMIELRNENINLIRLLVYSGNAQHELYDRIENNSIVRRYPFMLDSISEQYDISLTGLMDSKLSFPEDDPLHPEGSPALLQFIDAAADQGIYVQLSFFDFSEELSSSWDECPWNPEKNKNNELNLPDNPEDFIGIYDYPDLLVSCQACNVV